MHLRHFGWQSLLIWGFLPAIKLFFFFLVTALLRGSRSLWCTQYTQRGHGSSLRKDSESLSLLHMTPERCASHRVCSFPRARAGITVGWVKSVCQHPPPHKKWQQSCKMSQPHREILLFWQFPRTSAQLSNPGIPRAWQCTAGWVLLSRQSGTPQGTWFWEME